MSLCFVASLGFTWFHVISFRIVFLDFTPFYRFCEWQRMTRNEWTKSSQVSRFAILGILATVLVSGCDFPGRLLRGKTGMRKRALLQVPMFFENCFGSNPCYAPADGLSQICTSWPEPVMSDPVIQWSPTAWSSMVRCHVWHLVPTCRDESNLKSKR